MRYASRDVVFIPQDQYPPMLPTDKWETVVVYTGEALIRNKTHGYYMTAQGWKLPKEMFDK